MNKTTLHLKANAAREVAGLSINKLAKVTGVSRPTIQLYLRDKALTWNKETLESIAAALNVSPLDLFEVRNPEPVTSSHSG